MDSKFDFKELMKQRHSVRYFLSKPIPEETLKEIMSTSLLTPSWGNSQSCNIYIASSKTLEEIRKEWFTKNKEEVKGNSDINAGHKTDFSERCQENINKVLKKCSDVLNDPNCKTFMEANYILFNAPTVIYITVPKKRTEYNIFDTGALEMSIMLAAKEKGIDLFLLMKLLNIQIL